MASNKILRGPQVWAPEGKTNITQSTGYEMMARGEFPKPIALSNRTVGWIEAEIDDWIEARIAARNARVVKRESALAAA